MYGDFSRVTHNPLKRFTRLLKQQGRVDLDADANELVEILTSLARTQGIDVIGRRGVPKNNAGFGVLDVLDDTLVLSPGRLYIAGILCELPGSPVMEVVDVPDTDVIVVPEIAPGGESFATGQWVELWATGVSTTIAEVLAVDPDTAEIRLSEDVSAFATATTVNVQRLLTLDMVPDMPDVPIIIRPEVGEAARTDLVYLDVWERHISAIEDPDIRETALGGPDTTTRTKTIYQVRLLTDVGDVTCESGIPGYPPPPTDAVLTTRADAPADSADLCIIAPGGGYRGLENRFYRVEVHEGSDEGTPTFKWSKHNGAVIYSVEAFIAGEPEKIRVKQLGRDQILALHIDDWIEVSDDDSDLRREPGIMAQIVDIDEAQNILTLSKNITGFSVSRHAKVRRWDQNSDAIAITNAVIDLEDGISVQFGGTVFRSRDYWQFAARTITASGTSGIDELTAAPPRGVTHHHAPLALLHWGVPVDEMPVPLEIEDCRLIFPPLNAITADDVSFDNTICDLPDVETVQEAINALCQRPNSSICTLTARPGPGWESIFDQIPEGGHAEVCFPAGDYVTNAPVIVQTKGFLTIRGAGGASRIIAQGETESTLVFDDCAGVLVRDLFATADFVQEGDRDEEGLNGTLMFRNCGVVELESVVVQCGHGMFRAANCINIINHSAEFSNLLGSPARGLARIHGCRLLVGHAQIGAMVINGARTQIEDNVIALREQKPFDLRLTMERLRNDIVLRAEVRRLLINDIETEWQGQQGGNRIRISVNDFDMNFRVHPELIESGLWNMLIDIMPPNNVDSELQAREYLLDTADTLLSEPGMITFFNDWLRRVIEQDTSAMYQGIVVAGQESHEIRVLNNTVIMAAQGIHIGLSGSREDPLRAQDVQVIGNTVYSVRPPSLTREAHGIYLGNFASTTISNNRVRCNTLYATVHLPNFGFQVIGYFGERLIMRDNEARAYSMGMYANAINGSNDRVRRLWVVRENLATTDLNPANAFITENNVPV